MKALEFKHYLNLFFMYTYKIYIYKLTHNEKDSK